MDAKTIVRDVQPVYERFRVLPNLQLHMKRVAAVLAFLADHWRGVALDRDLLIASGLLHDLGNITKLDWEWEGQAALLGEEWGRKEHWQAVQEDVFRRYGEDHGVVTGNMLRELNVDARIISTVHETGYKNLLNVAKNKDWYVKLLVYADLRVAPHGVVSITERMEEGRARYAQLHPRIRASEGFLAQDHEVFFRALEEIEQQIAAHLSVPITAITSESVKKYVASF